MAQVVEDLPSKLKALSSNPCITHTYPKKKKTGIWGPGTVFHAYNSSYLTDKDWEDHGLRLAPGKNMRPYPKKITKARRASNVDQECPITLYC
jgi:hypothetical protein